MNTICKIYDTLKEYKNSNVALNDLAEQQQLTCTSNLYGYYVYISGEMRGSFTNLVITGTCPADYFMAKDSFKLSSSQTL